MKNIILKRPNEKLNKNLSYKIFAKTTLLGVVQNGKSIQLTIPDNLEAEKLYGKLSWGLSNKIDIKSLQNNQPIYISANQKLAKLLPLFTFLIPILPFFIYFFSEFSELKFGLIFAISLSVLLLIITFFIVRTKTIILKS